MWEKNSMQRDIKLAHCWVLVAQGNSKIYSFIIQKYLATESRDWPITTQYGM